VAIRKSRPQSILFAALISVLAGMVLRLAREGVRVMRLSRRFSSTLIQRDLPQIIIHMSIKLGKLLQKTEPEA
jgi:hypothetical protein